MVHPSLVPVPLLLVAPGPLTLLSPSPISGCDRFPNSEEGPLTMMKSHFIQQKRFAFLLVGRLWASSGQVDSLGLPYS